MSDKAAIQYLRQLHADISSKLNEIAELLPNDYALTLVARNKYRENADVVLTSEPQESEEAVLRAIKFLFDKGRPGYTTTLDGEVLKSP